MVLAAGCSLGAAGSAHALSFTKTDYADPAPFSQPTQSIAVGDMDHANGPDVVVLNQLSTGAGRLDVFLSNSDGTFPSTPSTTTGPICASGENARNVIVGEFDGDTNLDALVLCSVDVVVEHGNGLGGFTNSPTRYTNVSATNPLVLGEFHADGVAELVYRASGGVVCYQPVSLLAISGGSSPTCDSSGSVLNTSALALERLSGGVKLALGFTGTTGSQSLYYVSHSVAGFSSSTRPAGNATETADAISVADLNGDGNPDIVMGAASGTTGTVQVYVWDPATGVPATATPASYTSTIPVNYTAIADFDRDRHPDVAAAGYNASIGDSSGAIAVFRGNGDGTLQTPPQSFAMPGLGQQAALSNVGETRLAVADLNGDGVPDLVAGTDTGFSVLINTTPAPPVPPPPTTGGGTTGGGTTGGGMTGTGGMPGGGSTGGQSPNSAFAMVGNPAVNPKTGAITFTESVLDPGLFSWRLSFGNGNFGIFSAAMKASCKKGQVKLNGRCWPSKVVFGAGSKRIEAPGTFSVTVTPSRSAATALKHALKKKKGLRVTAVLIYQSARGGSPASHSVSVSDKLTKSNKKPSASFSADFYTEGTLGSIF